MRPLCGPVTTRLHLAVSLFAVTRLGLALPRVLCMYRPRAGFCDTRVLLTLFLCGEPA